MQGITLLLEVVKQDPNNHAANLNLGMFAMKSGQYDKAVIRFKT
jgi:cytochrome c-type biogenesis protein CcmH/NrfG